MRIQLWKKTGTGSPNEGRPAILRELHLKADTFNDQLLLTQFYLQLTEHKKATLVCPDITKEISL